jgi:hypothetical protein
MRKLLLIAGIAIVFVISYTDSFAQFDLLFAPIDCREHAEFVYESEVVDQPIIIDSTLITAETINEPGILNENPWMQWKTVENFTFGKDRGTLSMITDLNALHPFFRDKIEELMIRCKKQGIELAIVETYRTHAKQNEYRTMGRKYTNSTGGKSKHQYGLAVDVVPLVKGVAVWDNVFLWRKIGTTGEKLGLRWGGRWRNPYDPGHFEWTGGLTSTHLASGLLPQIPQENYPCIHEDIDFLRHCWNEWELMQQEVLTRKNTIQKEKSN